MSPRLAQPPSLEQGEVRGLEGEEEGGRFGVVEAAGASKTETTGAMA